MPNHLIKIMALVIGLFPFAAFLAAGDAVDPAAAGAVPSVPEIARQGYKLAFSDEFNGTKLDEEKWVYRVDSKGLSTELPANVTVSDGLLHLAVKKESAKGKAYTGGGIISKAEFQYGYYEARFKVPPGKGWHTSFWTMHYNGRDTNPTPQAQEIDICEQDSGQSHSGYSAGLNAWGAPLKNIFLGRRDFKTPDLARDYHIWGMEFTPTVVNFYFDGKFTHSVDATLFANRPGNIWLTTLGYGQGIDDSHLPSEARFDYVRFFTKP